MTPRIHPSAVIDPGAAIGGEVEIGPYAVIGPAVTIGDRSVIGPHAVLERNVVLGPRCRLGPGVVIGTDPQDLKYDGAETWVEIGEGTRIREYATVNRASRPSARTRIGRDCFVMSYAHVGHDCVLEDDVTLANGVQLGGFVTVEAHASIGGASAVHQFTRIGTRAFVGGGSSVRQDVPPFARAAGNPMRLYGVNTVGLRRAGLTPEARLAIQRAFRLLFNSELSTTDALDRLRTEEPDSPEVRRLLDFFARSDRGVLV
ncbi:MAG: acyl-ACP--UDP-N-acetylglucosamine O-acyltransferase [Gemmatimonadetes bacterium]|nr:acyl-ACP--UDP-N-acetylglucosamine O-acyltransferase [Gemmatimonadota bacterium]